MSKIVTLSNIKHFIDKLDVGNGGGGIRYKNIQTHKEAVKNGSYFYDSKLYFYYYNKEKAWYEQESIKCYKRKKTKHSLVIAQNQGDPPFYAGIVETTDPDASHLRVRIKGKTYAVANTVFKAWKEYGNVEVVGNDLVLSLNGYTSAYIYSEYPLPFFGDKEIEIYFKCSKPDVQPVATNCLMFFRLVKTGFDANNVYTYNNTKQPRSTFVMFEIYDVSGVQYVEVDQISDTKGTISVNAPFRKETVKTEGETERVAAEHEYLLKHIPHQAVEVYCDGELKLTLENIGTSPPYTSLTSPINLSIALGDICSSLSNRRMPKFVISDFYTKIDGETVLSFEDMKRQFS